MLTYERERREIYVKWTRSNILYIAITVNVIC